MGKSDPIIIPIYQKMLGSEKKYENVAFLGFSEHNNLTRSIKCKKSDFYDLSLGNWNINDLDWNIPYKYDLVVCTRCAYFAKDVTQFFKNIEKISNIDSDFLIDWGVGDHWRFENYKVGWVKNKEHEYAYNENNFLWSAVWHDEFLNHPEFLKFESWVKKFGYKSVKEALVEEVPELFNLDNLPKNITISAALISLWEESPQLYIILKGKFLDENISQ
jgi:hypothetical protein